MCDCLHPDVATEIKRLSEDVRMLALEVETRNMQWDSLMAQLETVWIVIGRIARQSEQVCNTEAEQRERMRPMIVLPGLRGEDGH